MKSTRIIAHVKVDFIGKDCSAYDRLCDTYCSPNALCRSGADRLNSSTSKPDCICPLNHVGPRCTLKHQMASIHVDLNMTNTSNIQAAVVQLYDIDTSSFQLLLRYQQAYQTWQTTIGYNHSDVHVPSIGLLKIYENFTYLEYFIIYHLPTKTAINITSLPEHCPHTSSLFPESWNNNSRSISSVFRFHMICLEYARLFCFHDEIYLCFCQSDHYGAECFNHNIQIDRCNNCLSNTTCIQGDLNNPKDFLCLCPPDYHEHRCEFHSQPFENTTSSMFNGTKKSMNTSFTSLVFLFFIIGFIFNY